jgi:non-homologous end joining protein Ku
MRPYWKGYPKLALSRARSHCTPPAKTAERIVFRQINKATGFVPHRHEFLVE